jgi:long-chain acyl-CoA synthetase
MLLALASILAESALRHETRTAVVAGEKRIGYAELWEDARRYAAFFRSRGIEAGDRVAMLLPNVPDFPRVYFGIVAIGAVAVPVHALLTPQEIAYVLRDSGAKVLVADSALFDAGARGAQIAGVPCIEASVPGQDPIDTYVLRDLEDVATILYTSGTTGAPKGAMLSQGNLVLNATVVASDMLDVTSSDIFLCALPLFHTFGQTVIMNTAFRAGASIVLMSRFDGVAALDLMIREGVTIFEGVPTMYIALLDAAKERTELPRLRMCVSGGAPLPLTVLHAFDERFDTEIYEGYGLTETSPVASFNQRDFVRKPGTIGRGIWGIDIDIAAAEIEDRIDPLPPGELGEVVVRGHCVFKGYLNKPDETKAVLLDGWFRTGDLGTKDRDGFVTIVDRKKDMILRGGYNVYPREVEEVLMRHPAVNQVAVIGIPHDVLGEEVAAIVIRDESSGEISAEELIAWSQEHLAKYKYPRHVHFVQTFPLGPSGKVLKRELRARFSQHGSVVRR